MEVGSIVISKAGRDKGMRFIILRTEGEYAFLADGALRKADKPKKKKLKHIQKTNSTSQQLCDKLKSGEAVENFEIRKVLDGITD